jgi:murein DD-endopeptidase MepM/ murein hydrolase activator NlpD
MRRAWPIAIVLVLLWLAVAAPAALGQESPSPTPDPSATETPTPGPDPSPSTDPSPSGDPSPSLTGTPSDPSPTPDPSATPPPNHPHAQGIGVIGAAAPSPRRASADGADPHRNRPRHRNAWRRWSPSTPGAWSTRELQRAAIRARRHGWSTRRIARRIFAPFPMMGFVTWSDSWGAPRFAGGYHPHAGQDLLCGFGAPVLAVEDATVTYGWNALGGTVAYLTRSDGSFWYYAHLSATEPGLDGAQVRQGDIIGRCGQSGDATIPHLHFGFYTSSGVALDPMHPLRAMLRTAERSLGRPAAGHTASVPTPAASTALQPTRPLLDLSAAAIAAPAPPPEASSSAVHALLVVGMAWPFAALLVWAATVGVRRTRRRAAVGA